MGNEPHLFFVRTSEFRVEAGLFLNFHEFSASIVINLFLEDVKWPNSLSC